MKEIWINLELYFESYEFYNFQGFFLDFFDFIFNFKPLLNNKKRVYFSCGATWMRRGNPSHVAAPHGLTRRLRSVIISIYIIYSIISIMFGLLSYRRVYDPLNRRVL